MPILLSPELVLVLPEAQRAAAIRALAAPPVWSPEPLGPAIVAAERRTTHTLIGAALLYFAVKFVWTLATAAMYVVTIVGVVIVVTLIF
jgi:hypothetical protein